MQSAIGVKTESDKTKLWWFMAGLALVALVINCAFLPHDTPHPSSVQEILIPPATPQVAFPQRQYHTPDTSVATHNAEEDAKAQEAAKAAKYIERYINGGYVRKPGTKAVAVAVASDDGKLSQSVTAAIANHIRSDSVETITTFFRPEFVTDALFNRAFAGSRDVFDRLELTKSLDVLLLGREEVQYSTDSSLENLVTAHLHLEIVAFFIGGNGQSQAWTFTANGPGFKQSEARSVAEERLIKQISRDTKMSL